VDGIETHVAWPADAHEGVQIGPVVVQHGTYGMYEFGDIQYLAFE
jgi:hypothetical protein